MAVTPRVTKEKVLIDNVSFFCLKTGHYLNVPLALNIHVLREGINYMFVVTHEPIVSFTQQPQQKGVRPDTEKNQIKCK